MWIYFFKRILMIIPTLFGITLLSFIIINLAPGSPLEQELQKMKFASGLDGGTGAGSSTYGVSEEVLEALKKQYGFDKPLLVRYGIWLKNIATFDFGDSFSTYDPVLDMIIERFPVSLQFGLVSLFFMYLICIPLGVFKAVKDGTHFDAISSFILFVMYSIPPLMLGILLIVFFAGGSFYDWFPLGGLHSEDYEYMLWYQKIFDRIHHFVLPMICYMIGSFTVLTFLMKNSLLDVIKLDYIRTARSKGLEGKKVVYKHALRNALIPLATGLSSILGIFLAGSIIIEQIFSLEGIGLLSYKAALDRDYNVLMGLIFIQSILMLIGRIISDFLYIIIDPRIDFS